MNDVMTQDKPTTEATAKVVYILYLVSLVLPITAIVGVVLAYINIDDAPDWLESHYRFQIRTFWVGALYMIVGVALSFIVIGYVVLLFCLIWLIVRCAKGLKYLGQSVPHPAPNDWLL